MSVLGSLMLLTLTINDFLVRVDVEMSLKLLLTAATGRGRKGGGWVEGRVSHGRGTAAQLLQPLSATIIIIKVLVHKHFVTNNKLLTYAS